MIYRKYNNNPKGKKTSDCVIRAISHALSKDWCDVADELFLISKKLYTTQTSTQTYTKYLENYQTIPVKYVDENTGKNKRFKVKDITWSGTFIIVIANHLTMVKDGILYDTWDCREKSCYKIWRIK